jgi:hypothetical protein
LIWNDPDVSGDHAVLMTEVVTSDMSVIIYQTAWCNIPENSHLHTYHHENLRSHHVLKGMSDVYPFAKVVLDLDYLFKRMQQEITGRWTKLMSISSVLLVE